MLRRIVFLFCCTLGAGYAAGDESTYGVTVPLTLTSNLLYTNAKQTDEGLRNATSVGFRALISPSVRLGSHWFLYSAFDIQSASYFTGTGYTEDQPPVRARVAQAFAGYSDKVGKLSFLVKAGQLSSAFGLAPVEYDDAKMALPTPPLLYLSNVQLPIDEIPSGVRDLLYEDDYGHAPVTLYGLPGIETELSLGRLDGRLQITSSSPSNPQSLLSRSQSVQWTAAAGYTFPGGLHLGGSAFRGAYLNADVQEDLPPGASFRDYKGSGVGIDAQWFHGSWSAEGEWQRFRFEVPYFLQSPAANGAYAQVKRILSPRTYFASRLSYENFGPIEDGRYVSAPHLQEPRKSVELGIGYRLNRRQLIKAGFALSDFASITPPGQNSLRDVFQLQLVTDVTALSRTFR